MIYVTMPAYREKETPLRELVQRLRIATANLDVKFVLIDDGNGSDTQYFDEIADIVIRHGKNKGYTAAILSGFNTALNDPACEAVLTIDSDGQHFPERIPSLIEAYHSGNSDIVLASRYYSEPYIVTGILDDERIAVRGKVVEKLAEYGVNISDPFTGYRLFSRHASKVLMAELQDHAFANEYDITLELILKLHTLGLNWTEVPCELHYSELKRFPGKMENPDWRLQHYFKMIERVLEPINV